MNAPSPRFARAADGTPLAFRSHGEGPALVLANGVTTSAFSWRRPLGHWQRSRRVVVWDYKGHGDSGPARDLDATTVRDLVDDMRRVMDAADVETAALAGFSMGSQVVLEACKVMPERIRAVVSVLGPAGRLFDTALPPFTGRVLQHMLGLMGPRVSPLVMGGVGLSLRTRAVDRIGRLFGYIGRDAEREDMERYSRHFRGMHYETVRRIAVGGGRHDAADVLPRMPAPLLIIAGDADPFAPAETVGAVMHAKAPSSRLHRMPHGTHTSLFEHGDEIGRVVEHFLDDVDPPVAAAASSA